jgi:hypothetical protein
LLSDNADSVSQYLNAVVDIFNGPHFGICIGDHKAGFQERVFPNGKLVSLTGKFEAESLRLIDPHDFIVKFRFSNT